MPARYRPASRTFLLSRYRRCRHRRLQYRGTGPLLGLHTGLPHTSHTPAIEVDWVLFPVFYWVTGVTCD